jgi:hypothetical protein
MDLELILEMAEESLSLKPDGFDGSADGYNGAIVGITDNGQLVYSKERMIELLVEMNNEMTIEDAWEFLEYNCFNAYIGEKTPIYINTY